MPARMKVRDGETKYLLRRVLDRYVPPTLTRSPKSGFGVPVGNWLRGPLRPWAEELLSPARITRDGYLREEPIREMWNAASRQTTRLGLPPVGRADVPVLARHVGEGLSIETDDVEIRRALPHDLPAILALAHRSLRWNADDEEEQFFRWKHLENPLGASPMWVACIGDQIVGFRTFLRWEFARTDDTRLLAVRAVDTATDPDFQGRGIFTRLTLHGISELQEEGVGIIFNTPNSKSLPGYLKMGWQMIGRPAISVMPTRIGSIWPMMGARTAASRNSIEMRVGESPGDGLRRRRRGEPALPSPARATKVSRPCAAATTCGGATASSRCGTGWCSPVRRPKTASPCSTSGGGDAPIEATVCDVLVPEGSPGTEHRLMKEIARLTQADYLLRIDRRRMIRGFVRLPKNGPILTGRSIDGRKIPELSDLSLSMGDVELF